MSTNSRSPKPAPSLIGIRMRKLVILFVKNSNGVRCHTEISADSRFAKNVSPHVSRVMSCIPFDDHTVTNGIGVLLLTYHEHKWKSSVFTQPQSLKYVHPPKLTREIHAKLISC